MHRYELIAIISTAVADDDVSDTVDRLIRRPVESEGGTCEEVNLWGRRKLAYPIQRQTEGNYVLTNLQMEPQRTKDLERGLHISEEVLRHLLIRLDE